MRKCCVAGLFLLNWLTNSVVFAERLHCKKTYIEHNPKEFSLELPSNPTTGFQLRLLDYDKERFTLLEQHFVKPNNHLMGAPGVMVFTFRRLAGKSYMKSSSMIFALARSWESKPPMKQCVRVIFKQGNLNTHI